MLQKKYIYTYFEFFKRLDAEQFNIKELAILNYFIRQYKKIKKREGNIVQPYIPLSSNKLRKLAGWKYKIHLDRLNALGILRPYICPRTGIASYSHYDGRAFCRKYALAPHLVHAIKRHTKAIPEIVKIGKNVPRIKEVFLKDTARLDTLAAQKVARNYKKLEVVYEDGLNFEESQRLQAIQKGNSNAKQSKNTGRVTHILLNSGGKACRGRVTVDGELLTAKDASSLHPYLLASKIVDPVEKAAWLTLCGKGIYSIFQGRKDVVKKRFGAALSDKTVGEKTQEIRRFIAENFPSLAYWITSTHKAGKTVQGELQRLEAQIFIPAFLCCPFFALPLHDALLVKTSDAEKAKDLLGKFIFERLGYYIPLK